jgi:hypothetical protein
MRLRVLMFLLCGLAVVQVGCEAVSTEDTGSSGSSGGAPVVVTDCSTATVALKDAAREVRNRSNKVENRCVNANTSFNASKCSLRLDELSGAVDEVTAAEIVVRSRCSTL